MATTAQPIVKVSSLEQATECDLCGKEQDVVVATFRTAFPPDALVCFGCLRKLILVDHKHHERNGRRPLPAEPAED